MSKAYTGKSTTRNLHVAYVYASHGAEYTTATFLLHMDVMSDRWFLSLPIDRPSPEGHFPLTVCDALFTSRDLTLDRLENIIMDELGKQLGMSLVGIEYQEEAQRLHLFRMDTDDSAPKSRGWKLNVP